MPTTSQSAHFWAAANGSKGLASRMIESSRRTRNRWSIVEVLSRSPSAPFYWAYTPPFRAAVRMNNSFLHSFIIYIILHFSYSDTGESGERVRSIEGPITSLNRTDTMGVKVINTIIKQLQFNNWSSRRVCWNTLTIQIHNRSWKVWSIVKFAGKFTKKCFFRELTRFQIRWNNYQQLINIY